jgi:dCMP deaminase
LTISRPAWNDYFLGIAKAVSARGDCVRRQVGCVIVSADKRVVSVGYNGVRPGLPGCLDGACPRATSNVNAGVAYDGGPGYCISSHAEASALLYADYSRLAGGAAYITDEPCYGCRKLLSAVPIKRTIWPEGVIEYGRD